MIRLRDRHTGAEAEWDRHKWSGDPGLVKLLQMLSRWTSLSAHTPFADIQARMAEEFPPQGVDVVAQTKPEEWDLSEEALLEHGIP